MSKVENVVACLLFAATGILAYHSSNNLKQVKEEVRQIDSLRYENALKRVEERFIKVPTTVEDHTYSASEEISFWRNELKVAKDSVNRIHKSYFEGSQLVNDSIKKTTSL